MPFADCGRITDAQPGGIFTKKSFFREKLLTFAAAGGKIIKIAKGDREDGSKGQKEE